jgi:hypothetical protein
VQVEEQLPPAQIGVPPEHCVLVWHGAGGGVGTHAPLVQVVSVGQAAPPLQSVRHWPSSHTVPAGHWLEYVHEFDAAVQLPPAQTRPVAQSAFVVQPHGPRSPPHFGPASTGGGACPLSGLPASAPITPVPPSGGFEIGEQEYPSHW